MKKFAASTLAVQAVSSEQMFAASGSLRLQIESDAPVTPLSERITKNQFGCIVEETVFANNYVEKVVKAPLLPLHLDYAQQERSIKSAIEFHKNLRSNGPTVYTCDSREPGTGKAAAGKFFPVFAADVSLANPTATFAGKCFDEITFEFAQTSDSTFDVWVTTGEPKSHLCSDTVLFANTEIQHFEIFYFRGKHKISF